jgi:hypothetical protein
VRVAPTDSQCYFLYNIFWNIASSVAIRSLSALITLTSYPGLVKQRRLFINLYYTLILFSQLLCMRNVLALEDAVMMIAPYLKQRVLAYIFSLCKLSVQY